MPSANDYFDLINQSASAASDSLGVNVRPELLTALIKQESNFNPNAVSPKGAAGPAQFMPDTARQYGLSDADRFNPAKAIPAAARLMGDLLKRFDGDEALALAGYNAGPNRDSLRQGRIPAIPETQDYIRKINSYVPGGLITNTGIQVGDTSPASPRRRATGLIAPGMAAPPDDNGFLAAIQSVADEPNRGGDLSPIARVLAAQGHDVRGGNVLGQYLQQEQQRPRSPTEQAGITPLITPSPNQFLRGGNRAQIDDLVNRISLAEGERGAQAFDSMQKLAKTEEWNKKPAIQSPTDRTWGQAIADTAPMIMQGGVDVVRAVNEIDRAINPFAIARNKVAQATGADWLKLNDSISGTTNTAKAYWQDQYSDGAKAQQAEVAKAEGFVEKVKAMVKNPASIQSTVSAQVIPMLLTMGLGGVAARAAGGAETALGATAAGRVGVTSEMLQSGGITADEVRNTIMNAPDDVFQKQSDAYRALRLRGVSEKEAKATMADVVAPTAGMASAALTGLVGKLTGEGSRFAKYLDGKTSQPLTTKLKDIGKETINEGMQNPGEDAAKYFGQSIADPNAKYDFGGSVAEGMVGGLAQSAGMQGAHAALRIGQPASAVNPTQPDAVPQSDYTPVNPVSPVTPSGQPVAGNPATPATKATYDATLQSDSDILNLIDPEGNDNANARTEPTAAGLGGQPDATAGAGAKSGFTNEQGEPDQRPATQEPNGQASGDSRANSNNWYSGLSQPVTAATVSESAQALSQQLEQRGAPLPADLQGRYQRYSDIASDATASPAERAMGVQQMNAVLQAASQFDASSGPQTAPPARDSQSILPVAQEGVQNVGSLQGNAQDYASKQNRDRTRAASVAQMTDIARNPDYFRLGPSRTPDSGAPMVFAEADNTSRIPASNYGKQDVAVMSDGQRVPFAYAVVDAMDIHPSHFADGIQNPSYASKQPGVIKALNNGRSAAMRSAYRQGTTQQYKQELINDAANHGVSPEAIANTQRPVLVRVYSQADNTPNMAAKSQAQGLGMSQSEQAAQDARLFDRATLDAFEGGAIEDASNRGFVRMLAGKMQQAGQDVAALMDKNGQLSQEGARRMQAALVHKAYGDSRLVQSLFESTDNDIQAIGAALKSVAGQWAVMQQAAANGQINPQTDITGNLMQAVQLIRTARRDRVALSELVRQFDIETGTAVDPLTVGVVRLFYTGDEFSRAVSKEQLTRNLNEYISAAMTTTADAGLFGDVVSPQAILQSILQRETNGNTQTQNRSTEPAGGLDLGGATGQTGAGTARPGQPSARTEIDPASRAEPAQPAASDDWLAGLFGVDPAEAAKQQQGIAAKAKAFSDAMPALIDNARKVIADTRSDLALQLSSWESRNYKKNATKVTFEGDGPLRNEQLSIGSINENRKNKTIAGLTEQIAALDTLERRIATENGAKDFVQRARGLYQEAKKAIDGGGVWAGIKTADDLFQARFIEEFGIADSGHILKNKVSGAALSIVKRGMEVEDFKGRAEPAQAQDFSLTQQTESELAQQDQARRDAEREQQAQDQAIEAKRKADAERDSFSLTGSDRVADSAGQGGLKFSQPRETPLSLIEISRRVDDQIQQWNEGTLSSGTVIEIGRPSEILKKFGVPDLPIHLTQSILRKAIKDKHGVKLGDLAGIALNIQSPIAIFASKRGPNYLALITEARHAEGNVNVVIEFSQDRNGIEINDIRSIHPKDDQSVLYWIGEGRLLGLEKRKGREWLENSVGSNSQQPQVKAALDKVNIYDIEAIRNPNNPTQSIASVQAAVIQAVGPQLAKRVAVVQSKEEAQKLAGDGAEKLMVAWHGSPHKFDRFSLDAIGTGEGAQAYGWGLYFAGKKEIAEHYREQLSASLRGWNYAEKARQLGIENYEAFRSAFHMHADGEAPIGLAARRIANASTAAREVDGAVLSKLVQAFRDEKRGALYQVNIPDDGQYLLWDKPLSEQPEAVREAVYSVLRKVIEDGNLSATSRNLKFALEPYDRESLLREFANRYGWTVTNGNLFKTDGSQIPESAIQNQLNQNAGKSNYRDFGQVYRDMSAAMGSDAIVSEMLNDAGANGIKYLDGTSRNQGDGSYNYVVFDDNAVQILETKQSQLDQQTEGFFNPATGKVVLIADALPTKERAAWVAWHELYHRGLQVQHRMELSSKLETIRMQNKLVEQIAGAIYAQRDYAAMAKQQNRQYGYLMNLAAEEAIAELGAAIEAGNLEQIEQQYGVKLPDSLSPNLKGAVAKFIDWMKGFIGKITGKPFTGSTADLRAFLAGARSSMDGEVNGGGEVMASQNPFDGREIAKTPLAKTAQSILVDGVERPAQNSNGQPIHWSEEGARNFWRWFGDSKVVDAQGRPLVVYHGTAADFTEFSKPKSNDKNGRKLGMGWGKAKFYFADSGEAASSSAQFAEMTGRGNQQNVMPVYLAMKKPIDANRFMDMVSAAQATGKDRDAAIAQVERQIKGGGVDGITDPGTGGMAVFANTQVKSAIGNNGQFNPADGNILRSQSEDFMRKVATAWKLMAQSDDLFRYNRPQSFELEGIIKEIDNGITVTEAKPARGDGADYKWQVVMPDGKNAEIYGTQDGLMWLDVSQLAKGESAGSKLYTALGSYAAANGKELIGDPLGLSDPALIRRTEMMLSSVLREETSAHLVAAERQENPWAGVQGINSPINEKVRPIQWRKGDDAHNLVELLKTSFHNVKSLIPDVWSELDHVRYNFETQQFEIDNSPVRDGYFKVAAGDAVHELRRNGFENLTSRNSGDSGRVEARSVFGSTTLKRAVITNTLLRESSSEAGWRRILAAIGRQLSGDDIGKQIEDLLYSQKPQQQPIPGTAINQQPPNQGRLDVNTRQPATAGFLLPEESKAQAFQRKIQDDMNRFTVLWREANQQAGSYTKEDADVYGASERYAGRVASRMRDFERFTYEPLMKRMADANITPDYMGQVLQAQHAEERNNAIAKINPNLPDGGSGMKTAEAKAILAEAQKSPQWAEMQQLADGWRDIAKKRVDMLVDAGVLSPLTRDAYADAYQFYVPLKGDMDGQGVGVGQGYSVTSKDKRALGHDARDEFVLENLVRDYERAVVQAEKNNVGKYLISFAAKNNQWLGDLITIGKPDKKQILGKGDPLTSPDGRVMLQASPVLADNEAQVYLNGQPVRIQIRDELLAKAYKNLGMESLPDILLPLRDFNRFLSKAYTGWNPEFMLKNAVRDATSGVINLTADQGLGVATKAAGNYAKAWAALYADEKNKAVKDPEWAALVRNYHLDGGSVGAAQIADIEKQAIRIQRDYQDFAGATQLAANGNGFAAAATASRKVIGSYLEVIEHLNGATENAFRLATYKAMLDSGFTRNQAASAAKNVTLNFNRRGETTSIMGALYLFFNPNVQGTARLIQSMTQGKYKQQAWALVAGMATVATIGALALRGMMGDDEWKNIPKEVKDRNLLIPTGGKGYITIPIPYEHAIAVRLGYGLTDIFSGDKPSKVASNVINGIFENYSPIGNPLQGLDNGKASLNMLPTALAMMARPAANVTSFGGPMYPESRDSSTPDNTLMNKGTRGSIYDKASQLVSNNIGSRYANEWFDVSPETLKYWTSTLTGGAGRFLADSISLPMGVASGEDVALSSVPLVRGFVRVNTVKDQRSRFFEQAKPIEEATAELRRAIKANDMAAAQDIAKQQAVLVALGDTVKAFKDQQKQLRELETTIKLSNMTPGDKMVYLRDAEMREERLYDAFNRVIKGKGVE